MTRRLIFAVFAALALYAAVTSLVIIQEEEVALLTELGRPEKTLNQAGLALKWPDPIQSVIKLDRRLQSLSTKATEYLTADKENIFAGAFVLWRIKAPLVFVESVRDSAKAELRIDDLVQSTLGSELSRQPLGALLNDTEGSRILESMDRVLASVRPQALRDFGIEIVDVQLNQLSFPDQNLRSAYNRMRAEREQLAKRYRAEGEEEAAKIIAQTDKEVRELLATTYRDTEALRGQAQAEAMAIYASAYEQAPEFFELTRTLETYRKILGDNATLILSKDTPLFRYLDGAPEPQQ